MRVLFAVGCDEYAEAAPLNGAEADARKVFAALANAEDGWYDSARSRLLLSPTLGQVREALRGLLFGTERLETFTFFFAGHGGVTRGSFYMWLRDTVGSAQSATAFALADLFRYLNEATPRQTNIIIDACEGGGLIEDLGVLLKPELLGDAGTPALTLVATAARNQYANEVNGCGLGTALILDCVEGRQFVNDSHGVLDLVDIGRTVSALMQGTDQVPVVWGLNLYGPPTFCRNPRYDRDGMGALRDLVQAWPVEADAVIEAYQDRLWAAYTAASGDWDEEKFRSVVRSVVQNSDLGPEQASQVAERIAATFLQRCSLADDPFRGPLVVATIAASLLPLIASPVVNATATRLLGIVATELNQAFAGLIAAMKAEKFALLSSKAGGLADLYFLPLRICRMLGWAAATAFLCQTPTAAALAKSHFKELLRLVLENYAASVVALNDAQAPAWCTALAQAAAIGMTEEGEQLAGLVFHSLVGCEGRLARWDLDPEDALEFLLARSRNDFSACVGLVERPNETLTVLLRASRLYGLGHVFDEALWRLDGVSFSAFVPSNLTQFNDVMMSSGTNLVWTIGHDVCRVEEFASTWPLGVPLPQTTTIRALAVISALTIPDRQPWFLLEGPLPD